MCFFQHIISYIISAGGRPKMEKSIKKSENIKKKNNLQKNEDIESWTFFFNSFKQLWKTSKIKFNLIFLALFSFLTVLIGYFLGEFLLSKNVLGIVFFMAFYLVFFFFSLNALRHILNLALREFPNCGNALRFSLFLTSIFCSAVLSPTLFALLTTIGGSKYSGLGNYVSLIFVSIFYIMNIIFIFWGVKFSPKIDEIESKILNLFKKKEKDNEN